MCRQTEYQIRFCSCVNINHHIAVMLVVTLMLLFVAEHQTSPPTETPVRAVARRS